jgi:NAD(P)-dependent dehydrogenase (short-subunit alcohol dehydrogenase family)
VKIQIRKARLADSDELTAIAHAAKRYWGYPERLIHLWSLDLTKDGIRVNAVAPGVVYTPLHRETPKDVMATVKDITDAVMYLTTPRRSLVTSCTSMAALISAAGS